MGRHISISKQSSFMYFRNSILEYYILDCSLKNIIAKFMISSYYYEDIIILT